ncbi:MAG: hypothetical protein FJ215_01135 [Ignavibacteria bacterium]|nr:hypothetical protein [Ignavibacteria bacterium]
MRFRVRRLREWTFWHYQAIGWPIFTLGHLVSNIVAFGFHWVMISNILLQIAAGFLLSLVLREYYRRVKYRELPMPSLVVRIVLGSFAMTVVWFGIFLLIQYLYKGMAGVEYYLTFALAARLIALIYPEKLVWSALYFGIKFWLDWEKEREKADRAVALVHTTQLQMLRYQLNPHFLFNALNSVRALVDEDTSRAREVVTRLSEFLRYSLVSRDRTDVTLGDELDAVRNYLAIEKQRYEEKLEIVYEIEQQTTQCVIPGFLIQPLVENAVKYGMQSGTMPVRVSIASVMTDGALHIEVVNSGRWMDEESEHDNELGCGLKNVRMRLEQSYAKRHRLNTYEKNGQVHVHLELYQIDRNADEKETAGSPH